MSAPTGKLKFAYDSIANLEQQIATLRAQLAAAEARANELNAMLEHCRDEAAETERMLRAEYAKNQRDAERYRWLREHFRFANDSMRELWFDPALEPNDSSVPVDLDAEIDRAMSGANA